MGMDKAEVLFRGRTMLQTAVTTMTGICDEVVVIGDRVSVPAGAHSIPDTFPGCGPMGGIEAALRNCQRAETAYAVFLPVDMPLLPSGLLAELVSLWRKSSTVRIAVVVADGHLQPLVSLIHVDVLPTLQAALVRGDRKLQPALHLAAETIAIELRLSKDAVFLQTFLEFGDKVVLTDAGRKMFWKPSAVEWQRRSVWFANLNTPQELCAAQMEAEPSK